MSHEELTELAAKAAGISLASHPWTHRGPVGSALTDNGEFWDPRDNDGDALRLAAALAALSPGASFTLSISKMHDGRGFASAGFFSRDNPTQQVVDSDLRAATRGAIFLAAVEIGKAMP